MGGSVAVRLSLKELAYETPGTSPTEAVRMGRLTLVAEAWAATA